MKPSHAVLSAVAAGMILAGMSKGGGAALSSAAASPKPDSEAAVPVDASGNVGLGERLAAKYGWTGEQFDCLNTLWQGESGWSQYADTRKSGLDPADASVFAYGIPQARGHGPDEGGVTAPYPSSSNPANPASLGGDSSPRKQIEWGLSYIRYTYGSPCNALAFKHAHNDEGY
jgi:hypothetical protein